MKSVQPKTMLIISAHADDHIAAAGTLFKLRDRGYKLFEVVLTNSQEGTDFRKANVDYDVAEMRAVELSKASKFLGIEETFALNQPDLGLQYSKELMLQVVAIIRKVRPEIGIMHNNYDWHPDHIAANKISSEAFKFGATGVRSDLGERHRTPIVLAAEGMLNIQPNIYVDITEYTEQKTQLWKLYESQAKPQSVSFEEGKMSVNGYHLRRPGSLSAEAFTTDMTSPIILLD